MTILIYSGECRFCRFCARQLAKVDPQLHLIPLRDEAAYVWLGDLRFEDAVKHWWVITLNEVTWVGVRTAGNHGGWIALLKGMPWSNRVGRLLEWMGLTHTLDVLDDIINHCRPLLARCVPDGPSPMRVPSNPVNPMDEPDWV